MVQLLLTRRQRRVVGTALMAVSIVLLPTAGASPKEKSVSAARELWEMSLDGGRRLSWQNSFHSEADVKPNRGFWNKVLDVVAGAPDFRFLVRPYSIVTDSHGRVLVTDPGAQGVHMFDFVERKYKFIEHKDRNNRGMLTPQCVAVDAQDNIYVTDSDAGEIFVFEPSGRFVRAIGKLKGNEGYFKRPTGIAVDSIAQRIYVTDTLRDEVFILDMQGNILKTFGQSGEAHGEFNLPTELRLDGEDLLVVDAMNFRVQAFDRSGVFRFAIGKIGDSTGALFRPKAISVDSEGHIYLVDGLWGVVQVFDREGQLLYYFGARGTHAGEFQLPTGLFIDHEDHVFVVDSFNRRVQEFQYFGVKPQAGGGMQ